MRCFSQASGSPFGRFRRHWARLDATPAPIRLEDPPHPRPALPRARPMNAPFPPPSDDASNRRLAELERRLARLEAHLGVAPESLPDTPFTEVTAATPATQIPAVPAAAPVPASPSLPLPASPTPAGDDLEFQVGQNWFARIGLAVLAIGAAFTLSLPFASLPAIAPSLMGYVLAVAFILVARSWRDSFAPLAGQLRGVAMALLFFATLRLFFFGPRPVLEATTAIGEAVLALAVAANLFLAWRRQNAWLVGLGLLCGGCALVAVGTAGFVLPGLVVLAGLAVAFSTRGRWPMLWIASIPVIPAIGLIWALNDPFLGHPFQWVTVPSAAPFFVLAATAILASGPLWRRADSTDENVPNAGALVNCALGLGLFLVLTLLAPVGGFVPSHLAAAVVFLALAAVFRVRAAGEVPPFLYAMTGNLALSLAILRSFPMPDVFVWLSLQSILVVAAAVWFRSRFIVVANFLIYTMIVLAYAVLADRETGISVGFGIVALASARILHWQKDRLELKTELMRNAYLVGAFIVFPYALYHLVPVRHVGLAWVGLALFYYVMNLIVRSPKFRWMGHATLLLTTVYMLMVGTRQFEPVYRVLSFLVLGTVLLVVSMVFSRLRRPRAQ